MSRLTGAILADNNGPNTGRLIPTIDLELFGMNGYSPDLTGWVSNQAFSAKPLICLLVEAPKGFQLLPNPEKWIGTLKSIVELHAQSIEGLTATLEVEIASTPIGGAGQQHEDFTNVTEGVSKPVFKIPEKYGNAIANFFRGWITNLMMDPNSKYPNVITLGTTKPTDNLPDMYAATMIFIQPDPTHTKVNHAWLCTNMFPNGSGEITGRRDLTSAQELVVHDITFTAITQFGVGVNQFAQTLLDSISLTGANPQNRAAFVDKIDADIAASKAGYANGVETLGATSIKF